MFLEQVDAAAAAAVGAAELADKVVLDVRYLFIYLLLIHLFIDFLQP